ncbi:hypothetical protein E1B28_007734 [Marasmius oreades]|uniref:Major facilitator superfamily (MFS) profile domain-containing protein n=1 Tax=Marasmius oreades TaxID=181124 RepID=A0A9P7S2H4_9AGAR|nr:uncharacterized protein E1B28_007734 [Marasmius oreades]KAG7094122.1 hypothetical protein E1B28_007734 [Marasmius oreades]
MDESYDIALQRFFRSTEEVQKIHTSSSASGPSNDAPAIDPIAERRLLKKLDWRLLPLFTLLYCTSIVDRTSIGNAKIVGIERDLQLGRFDFNISLTVFYLFFFAAEVPSNLALKHFGPAWFSAMTTGFGLASIGTAFITSFAGLVITRAVLGITEACTLSGLVYLLSKYYRRSELVLRVAIFFGLSPGLGGAFGGLLASGLLTVGDIGTVKSWRKIFLIGESYYFKSLIIPY